MGGWWVGSLKPHQISPGRGSKVVKKNHVISGRPQIGIVKWHEIHLLKNFHLKTSA